MRQLARLSRQRLAGGGVADAETAAEPLGVEGAQGDPGLDRGDGERVGGHATGHEGAIVEAVEGELLDRGASAVWVEADLAEEDAVGPGDRPLAHVDRVRAVEAVGEFAQAAADRLGAVGPAALDLDPGDPKAGELLGEVRRDPALLGCDVPAQPLPELHQLLCLPDREVAAARGAVFAPTFSCSSRWVARSKARTRASSCASVDSPTLASCRVPPG